MLVYCLTSVYPGQACKHQLPLKMWSCSPIEKLQWLHRSYKSDTHGYVTSNLLAQPRFLPLHSWPCRALRPCGRCVFPTRALPPLWKGLLLSRLLVTRLLIFQPRITRNTQRVHPDSSKKAVNPFSLFLHRFATRCWRRILEGLPFPERQAGQQWQRASWSAHGGEARASPQHREWTLLTPLLQMSRRRLRKLAVGPRWTTYGPWGRWTLTPESVVLNIVF